MPRKFLGQRLDANIDYLRPASMGITNLDLSRLPEVPDFPDLGSANIGKEIDNSTNGQYGRRISRSFGGTMKLKKRLSSVPELLMHNQKMLENRRSLTVGVAKVEKQTSPVVEVEQSRTNLNHRLPKPYPALVDTPRSGAASRNLRARTSSPLAGPPIVYRGDKVVAFPAATHVAFPPTKGFHTRKKSDGELLFDEIIKAYGHLPKVQDVGNSKVNTAVHVPASVQSSPTRYSRASHPPKKQAHAYFDPIIQSDEDMQRLSEESFPSPIALEESLSSPEYTNTSGSDPSSSGEDFSDLASMGDSLGSPQSPSLSTDDDSTYVSADEYLPSVADLSLRKKISTACSIRRIRLSRVNPQMFSFTNLDIDSENEVTEPMTPLENGMAEQDTMDASSSLYEE
ncbi:LADA_0C06040g1_1 [Lachancea dasiensis]|uniref:LADA_0C06040g1_1 n=1 Tax=Lachancea dasiensis TaxID=1072105 RepID=A0A1G4IZ51_9SACH|nr:LADA_0C06040g1_1 [Lachancea dasiensis]